MQIKKLIFIIVCLLIVTNDYSQDLIIKSDSSKIYCRILKVDTATIYFNPNKSVKNKILTIERSNVLKYYSSTNYDFKTRDMLADTIESTSKPLCLKSKDQYLIGYFSYTNLFLYSNNSTLKLNIPYQTRDITTGISTSDTLRIKNSQPFKTKPNFLTLNFEINLKKNCYAFQLGAPTNQIDAGLFSGGYGKVFDVKVGNKIKFTIKPFLNLSYTYMNYVFSEEIDNANKNVYICGFPFGPTFKYTYHRSGKGSTSTIIDVDAKNIQFKIGQRSLYFTPQISIANNRKNRVFYSLNLGWLLPLFNWNSGLDIRQEGKSLVSNKTTIAFNNPSLGAYLNDNRINKFPFKIFSPYISFSLGFYLNK